MLKFSNNFMILSTSKLFLFLIVITISLLLYKKMAIPFIIFFVITYVLFTVFEVVNITMLLKKQNLEEKAKKA